MAEQTQEKHQAFLDKVIANTNLQTLNEAQTATNAVFRILRDLLPSIGHKLRKSEKSQSNLRIV